jgi:CRP/FNR family transcriptional regulator
LLVPGDLLGDIEAVDGSPALFESAAATPCRLIAFERAPFAEVTERSARASLEIARSVATRTRAIATNSIERHGSEARVRIAARLLDLAELLGHMRGGTIEMEMPMSQEELGRLAGMCRESACRALGKLRSEGVLELKGRKMRILKPDVLERIRCGAPTPVS